MPSKDAVILEYLAATGWFVEHGEVALTGGLTFCLEKDPAAAQAFLSFIRERTGLAKANVPNALRWQAEWTDELRNRIDLSGWADTAPVVFLEAKVSAIFAPEQVSYYTRTQQSKLADAGHPAGALVVLVPEIRVRSARDEVQADLARLEAIDQGQSWLVNGPAAVTVTVLSWDETLEAMIGKATTSKCDLEQLRGACRALQGSDVPAFTESDLAGGWRDRMDDLKLVIDRVTREATARLSIKPLPWQSRPSGGFAGGFRYLGETNLPNLAVGAREGGDAPFWVRWHHKTPDFKAVGARLTPAGYQLHSDDNGLWLPLDIEPDFGVATGQIASLIAQVVQLYKLAVDRPDPI